MANSFKYLADHDKVVTTNSLVEAVNNVKGTDWLSACHNPYYFVQYYTSSYNMVPLGTRTFDITFGRSAEFSSANYQSNPQLQIQKNIYNQYSKLLLGYTTGSSNQIFSLDPEDATGSKKIHLAYFVNFSRMQFKDRIKQGTFNLKINATEGDDTTAFHLVDKSGSLEPQIREARTGYVGKLFVSCSSGEGSNILVNDTNRVQGLIFYEAGIAVISNTIFSTLDVNDVHSTEDVQQCELGIHPYWGGSFPSGGPQISGSNQFNDLLRYYEIKDMAYGLASSILTSSYHSITELNSAIYFCRAFNHEFNYSSNPTFLSSSEIVVKDGDPEAQTRTFITTVGLYSDDNQLLAVAKLSEPIKKTPENELIARVRLDF